MDERGGPGSDPDAELIVQMASGNQEALSALYVRHAGAMLGLVLRIVRNRREAEDLLHDVFLEVWRAAKDFDPSRGRVRTWLAIRMRSRALDLQKSARVSRNAGDAELERATQDSSTMESAADHARVRAAVAQLPPEQRQVLELAYFDGLSASEIAAKLAIPIGTVKSRTAAAMLKLRAVIGPDAEERR